VELAAIRDQCLKNQFRGLAFVHLDKKDAVPDWLPDTHIRCVFDDYGLEQLAGAIKTKVQERGGVIRLPDAASEAQRVKQEAEYLGDRRNLLRSAQWVDGTVHPTVQWTLDKIVELIAASGLELRAEKGQWAVTITDRRISVVVG
jgi:hypothetical protein